MTDSEGWLEVNRELSQEQVDRYVDSFRRGEWSAGDGGADRADDLARAGGVGGAAAARGAARAAQRARSRTRWSLALLALGAVLLALGLWFEDNWITGSIRYACYVLGMAAVAGVWNSRNTGE